jgi:ribosomal-protein-alanine N-acetyltransferase
MGEKLDLKNVSVLWANIDHAADIVALHASLFEKSWDQSSIERMLAHPGSTALVARHGHPQQTVGFIMGQLAADEAEILSFGVTPAAQRSGIGRKLLEGLARAAKRADARRLFLEVADDNIPALVLYSRKGFREVGRRKNYYERAEGPAVDALVLELIL